MRKLGLLIVTLALTGCADRNNVYLRIDGRDMASNSDLRRQMEFDRLACQTEGGDDRECMTFKGYVAVPKEQAAAKQQQLAAAAAQNAANEAVPILPPPTVTLDKPATAKKRTSKRPDSNLRSSQD
jgi:hypothetical protein